MIAERKTDARTFRLDSESEQDLACELMYRFLAATFSDPRHHGSQLLFDSASCELAREAADLLREAFNPQAISLSLGESPSEDLTFTAFLQELPASLDRWNEEFERVFGLANCRGCPLYETEYHPNEDAFFRAQQMADVAGFYRAFGLEPESTSRERPDHVGLELEFCAFLLFKKRQALQAQPTDHEAAAICHAARVSFVRDHLSWWVPSFCLGLRAQAGSGFYDTSAKVLAALIPIERFRLGIPAPRIPLRVIASAVPEECDGCLL